MKPDLRSVVKEWLIEEERFETEIPPETVQGLSVEFAYQFKTHGLNHFVIQPKGEDKLILRSTITVSDAHRKLLQSLPRQARIAFLWDLRFGLLWKDTDFEMIKSGEDEVQQFVFTRILHADGLSKAIFEAAVSELHRANLFVSWNLQKQEELSRTAVEDR